MSKVDRYLILSGAIGSVTFALAILILGAMFPGYDHVRDYISELGAVDSPVKDLMNIFGFFLVGLFMIAFAIGLYRTIGTNWSGKTGSILILISGILFSSIAFFPCDPGCFNESETGDLHNLTSDSALPLGGIGFIFILFSLKSDRSWGKYLPLIVLLIILAFVLGLTYPELDATVYGGLVQRLAIGIPFSFMLISSLYLYKTRFLNNKTQ